LDEKAARQRYNRANKKFIMTKEEYEEFLEKQRETRKQN
jgi:hypothetical protein